MDSVEEVKKQHPDFPWLEVDDLFGVESCLRERGWLETAEHVCACGRAGEGNMNLTLLVETDQRLVVLKQARPWVEKYPGIAAPWERGTVEQAFYATVQGIPEVARRMPRMLHVDAEAKLILMEYLPGATDFSHLYRTRQHVGIDLLDMLAGFLAELHRLPPPFDPVLMNHDMRALNHAHMYVIPWQPDNDQPLDDFAPGLSEAARAVQADEQARAWAVALGEIYLRDGYALLHGDFFPGSWLSTDLGLRVIDPEFCFPGPAEFDLGIALAHFRLAGQPCSVARNFIEAYAATATHGLDNHLVTRFAAAEIVRRLIGVAQLPLPPGISYRAFALEDAHGALLSGVLEELWQRSDA